MVGGVRLAILSYTLCGRVTVFVTSNGTISRDTFARKTTWAASGSIHQLNSPASLNALPGALICPPIITICLIKGTIVGSYLIASATFVKRSDRENCYLVRITMNRLDDKANRIFRGGLCMRSKAIGWGDQVPGPGCGLLVGADIVVSLGRIE